MHQRLFAFGLLFLGFASVARGSDDKSTARWDFGPEEATPLRSQGGVHRDVPGPRPPEYPDFEAGNTAVRLDGSGAHLEVDDTGTESLFDFTNRDAIAIEAWVQVDDLRAGENLYVIGKGRTGAPGFAADNQNWALRVRERQGKACVSFLFATAPMSGAVEARRTLAPLDDGQGGRTEPRLAPHRRRLPVWRSIQRARLDRRPA